MCSTDSRKTEQEEEKHVSHKIEMLSGRHSSPLPSFYQLRSSEKTLGTSSVAATEVRFRTQTPWHPVWGVHPSGKLTSAGLGESWPSGLAQKTIIHMVRLATMGTLESLPAGLGSPTQQEGIQAEVPQGAGRQHP